jgi:protein phosphatase
MGGHAGGNVASRIVIDAIAELIKYVDRESGISVMLETANRRLFEAMYTIGGRPGMGTTVVGAVLSDRDAIVFNVGDSRAYMFRRRELIQLSRDDTLSTGHGALRNRSRALTQSLGGSTRPQDLQPHFRRTPLDDLDTLLLCSDGLTDMIDEDEIAGILARHREDPADQLVAAALDAGGQDNITVVVVGPSLI